MSYLANEEVSCQYCSFPNPAEIWTIINVYEDPELKEILLGGELNMMECEACHQTFYADHFLLYHDPREELLAFVYPLKDRQAAAACEEKTRQNYEESQRNLDETERLSYPPLTMFGLDELLHRIEAEDEARLQGEIVSYLAKDLNLDLIILKPSSARKLGLPPLLPALRSSAGSIRERVSAGLEKILGVNEHLDVYRTVLGKLSSTPDLQLSVV